MKKKKIIIVSLLLLTVILIPFGFSYAKYVASSVWDYYLSSKGFYFTSDYLSDTEKVNVDNIWDGSSVLFNIGNYLNDEVITEYDIKYEVSCEVVGNPNLKCVLNGGDSSKVVEVINSNGVCVNNSSDLVDVSSFSSEECVEKGYDYTISKVLNELSFDIISLDDSLVSVAEVIVTARSVEPYSKKLSGKFLLSRNAINEGVTANLEKNSDYYRLVISNPNDGPSCVKVSFSSDKFRLDANTSKFSDFLVDSDDYIKSFTTSVDPYKSVDYIIYSTDNSKNYSISDFLVEEVADCVK